jgi:hypothetical protein
MTILASTQYFDIIPYKKDMFSIQDRETKRVNVGWCNFEDALDQAQAWDQQMEDYGEVVGY